MAALTAISGGIALNSDSQWIEYVDDATGNAYYYNKATKLTTYAVPIEGIRASPDRQAEGAAGVILSGSPATAATTAASTLPTAEPTASVQPLSLLPQPVESNLGAAWEDLNALLDSDSSSDSADQADMNRESVTEEISLKPLVQLSILEREKFLYEEAEAQLRGLDSILDSSSDEEDGYGSGSNGSGDSAPTPQSRKLLAPSSHDVADGLPKMESEPEPEVEQTYSGYAASAAAVLRSGAEIGGTAKFCPPRGGPTMLVNFSVKPTAAMLTAAAASAAVSAAGGDGAVAAGRARTRTTELAAAREHERKLRVAAEAAACDRDLQLQAERQNRIRGYAIANVGDGDAKGTSQREKETDDDEFHLLDLDELRQIKEVAAIETLSLCKISDRKLLELRDEVEVCVHALSQ